MSIITLTFESVMLLVSEKDKAGELTGEKVQAKDQNGDPAYERDDILALRQLLNIVEVSNLSNANERLFVVLKEKIEERWKAEDRDCEIEFNDREIVWLETYLKDVKSMCKMFTPENSMACIQSSFHSVAKISLLDQIESHANPAGEGTTVVHIDSLTRGGKQRLSTKEEVKDE